MMFLIKNLNSKLYNVIFIYLFSHGIVSFSASNDMIKIICTAALIAPQAESRKIEYVNAIKAVKQFGFVPYIVESCVAGPSFLDDLSDKLWYAKTNDSGLRNKGVNEVKALLHFFNHHTFNDDDIIVKVTGRYVFLNDSFFSFIMSHLKFDAFVRYLGDQVFTGCFAMRYKYLINFLENLNLQKMEQSMINLERELADYLALHKGMIICRLDTLGIAARIAFNNYIDYL